MSTLSAEIRRQFGAPATTRFYRSLPALRVEEEMPSKFGELLKRIDKAEKASRNN